MDVKNVKQVFIAANCARTASVQIYDNANATTYLGNGEVVIVDPQGNVLSNTTALKAVEYIQIVQRARTGDDKSGEMLENHALYAPEIHVQ